MPWVATTPSAVVSASDASREKEESSMLSLDLPLFRTMAASLLIQQEKALRAFELMDTDQKGFLSWHDLSHIARQQLEENNSMTDEDLQEMILLTDGDDKGYVDRKDFLRIARKVNL